MEMQIKAKKHFCCHYHSLCIESALMAAAVTSICTFVTLSLVFQIFSLFVVTIVN